jgi:Carboxypeptidase regulatory-like domain
MRFASGLLLVGLLPFSSLFAQFSGRVTGSVVDASGASVPDAQVDLYLAGGKKPLLSTKTSSDGQYNFNSVRPASYDLTAESKGFLKVTLHNLTVDAARETSVPQIKLQVASVTETVEVTGDVQGVQLSNAEIADTVTVEQIKNLPVFDRDPLGLIQLQPGVVSNGNSATVINGLRTSYSDVTLDGVNIQDNYIRDNALDYTPNKLLLGQVRQVTLVSSNVNAAASGGATQTAFSTPSGTNNYHGDALWYNRNNAFSANDWFNNQAGVPMPFLNQHQFGLSIGGPIQKDKLFFYFNYEAVRTHQQIPFANSILTANAAQGIFSYKDTNGLTQKVNILTLSGLTGVDPTIQKLLAQIPAPSQANYSLVGDGLNTTGYRFNMRDNATRDNLTGKLDYSINTRHSLAISYLWNRYNLDRPDNENDFSTIPKATNPTHTNFLAASWRSTPSAHLTNEVRFGFNDAYAYFFNNQSFGSAIITGLAFSDPVNESQPQGRSTNTWTLADDAAWQHGHHNLQFGFHMQDIRVRSYDVAGVVPVYSLGMGSGQQAYTLSRTKLPGITDNDLGTANALLATLGGFLDGASQTFNVTSRTSGYVPGAPFVRNFILNDYAMYVQDNWRLRPRLTVTLGLRYELPGVADEANSLELLPVWTGGAAQTLLSNASLDFAGGSVGRPWYKRSWNAFAPSIGFAWDVSGNGKTAIRGGYSVSYVNDQEIIAAENMLEGNAGLQGVTTAAGLSNRLSGGLPPIVAPVFQVPTTLAQNYATNPFNALTSIDPNLHRPYVQQYSIGIQHELLHTVLEARYVGNHVVGAYRAFDYNQVQLGSNGFLADFLRAQANGFLSQSLGKGFNPAFSALTPGSQQLTVLNKFAGRGGFNDPNVVFYIETGQPGELATYYQTNAYNSSNAVQLFQNRYALGADMLTNYSSSSYNSLQLAMRHRTHSGLSFEANYTFSKVLSDGDGDLQTRFQAFLDFNNPKLERSRANFDLTHMIKADGYYDLPFGAGHRLGFKPLNRLIGGWTIGSVMVWQSGAPFSVLSSFATLNRAARSYYNGANTTVGGAALANIVHFQMTGNGPVEIAPSAINPADNSGVNAPGTPNFSGQVFSNPAAGTLGALQRRLFSGPWTFDIDASVKKTVSITERYHLELRGEAFNLLNHPTFYVGDQNINSVSPGFGTINSMFYTPRVMEFGAHLTF